MALATEKRLTSCLGTPFPGGLTRGQQPLEHRQWQRRYRCRARRPRPDADRLDRGGSHDLFHRRDRVRRRRRRDLWLWPASAAASAAQRCPSPPVADDGRCPRRRRRTVAGLTAGRPRRAEPQINGWFSVIPCEDAQYHGFSGAYHACSTLPPRPAPMDDQTGDPPAGNDDPPLFALRPRPHPPRQARLDRIDSPESCRLRPSPRA
jgi:hypothetical protein